MYERSYGYKYAEAGDGWQSAADIAKLIRADIKQAVSEGLLPGAPVKYSVTSESYSGGQSVNVKVVGWSDAWVQCKGFIPGSERGVLGEYWSTASACHNVWCKAAYPEKAEAEFHNVLSEDAQAAKMTLERIHSAYNHDGSDIQTDYFDVRYYGHVEFEDAWSAEWRAKHNAEQAAKKAARDGGVKVAKLANTNAQRKTTVHWVVENTEGKEVLLCGARVGRSSNYRTGDVNSDVQVTCSRCAKKGGAS